jgi:hypothetical protein
MKMSKWFFERKERKGDRSKREIEKGQIYYWKSWPLLAGAAYPFGSNGSTAAAHG